MTTVSSRPAGPRLRADASRNRARIIGAARETLVEIGAEAPLDEIARRAGVGNATLYRHFADRRDLLHHVTLSVLSRVLEHAEAGLREPDAFEALSRFTHIAADERIGALCPMLADHIDHDNPELESARLRLKQATAELIARAHASGQLRADIGVGDYFLGVIQLTRPLPGTGCIDLDQFLHRHLQVFLDGLRAPAPSVLPGRPVSLDDLKRAC
ncbi:TetR/AcrR family transcriptional regulator [Kitasatospora sp. NBC_01539]|uniref:TetR/AcrR family transcriptional regulator n=1 Tax=Kitasatospora sp. NBC_01539 TaxID=2903577 RepID=UPI00386029E4